MKDGAPRAALIIDSAPGADQEVRHEQRAMTRGHQSGVFTFVRIDCYCVLLFLCLGCFSTGHAEPFELPGILKRLIGGSTVTPHPVLRLTPEEAKLQVSRRGLALGITNAYESNGVRWLAIELSFRNHDQKPATIHPKSARLLVGEEELLRVQVNEELRNTPLYFDDESICGSTQILPEQLLDTQPVLVPANGGVAGTWLVFANLPRVRELAPMTVRLDTSEGQIDLELTRRENENLTLQFEQIGPSGMIGITHVEGEINAINIGKLQEQFVTAERQGVKRQILSFDRGGRLGDKLTEEWLVDGPDPDNERMQFYPMGSDLIPHLVFVQLPGGEDETDDHLTTNVADAIQQSTWDLFPRLAPSVLIRELQTGHPDIRRAILINAGDLIANDRPDLILEVLTRNTEESDDPRLRLSVIRSLRATVDPAAIPVLEKVARTGTRLEAITAMRAMDQSAQLAAQMRVVELAADSTVQSNVGLARLIRSIEMHGSARWLTFLRTGFQSSDPLVREAALKPLLAMAELDRMDVLQRALIDRHEPIRNLAYLSMANSPRNDEQNLYESETYSRMLAGKYDSATLSAVGKFQNAEMLPILLKLLDAPPADVHHALVTATISVGGNDGLKAVMNRLSIWDEETRQEIFRAIAASSLPEREQFLAQGIQDQSSNVREQCLRALSLNGDQPTLKAIFNALDQVSAIDSSTGQEVARWVGLMGTSAARQALLALGKDGNAIHANISQEGLKSWDAASPASNWIQAANYQTSLNELEHAITLLKLALEVDPHSSQIYNSLGFAQLRMSRVDEAKRQFEKALELSPADHNPLTGVAICLAIEGQCETAVAMVDTPQLLIKHGQQRVFLYNVACVYGRCLEHRMKEPESVGRDRAIKEFQRRAMKFLNASIEQGFSDVDLLISDPDLAPLRQLPEFEKAERRMREAN